jgi:hypothetical protein
VEACGGGAQQAVDLYRQLAYNDGRRFVGSPWRELPSIEAIRSELCGKDLACFCALDQPCHADVLLEIANRPIAAEEQESKSRYSVSETRAQVRPFETNACMASDQGYVCTKDKGHYGDHCGGTLSTVHCWASDPYVIFMQEQVKRWCGENAILEAQVERLSKDLHERDVRTKVGV